MKAILDSVSTAGISSERTAIPHTALGDERRRALIDAAYHLISERGMEGLRLRDVAARTGIHHATLHYYFPTKADVIQAVADRLGQEFITAHPPEFPTDMTTLSPREQLHWYFVSTAYQLRQSPERFIVISELSLHARRDAATHRILIGDATWQQYLIALLEAGINSGEFRADLDIARVTQMMIAFSMGLPLILTTQPDAIPATITQFEQMLLDFISAMPHATSGVFPPAAQQPS